ncbi:MAG: cytochrome c, partial [Gammaproteobacteria bacterium]|nr:cytochrome c [Gammaproteobacteria bacterium]
MRAKLLLPLIVLLSPMLRAQQLEQATYSEPQAQTGLEIYVQNCAACHLSDLTGSFEAPSLNDVSFRENWGNRSVFELFDLLRRTMPPQSPSSLTDEQYEAVIAYLLRENSIQSSQENLIVSTERVLFAGGFNSEIPIEEQRTPLPGR